MLPSEIPKLPTDPPVIGFPGVWKLLLFYDSLPRTGLHPYLFCLSFYLLYFVLPPFEDNGLPLWVPGGLRQHSEVVLWYLLSVQMMFWWILGEKVVSLSYSSAIFHVFWTWVWASSESFWWTEKPGMLQPWGHKELDMTQQLNWTDASTVEAPKYIKQILTDTKWEINSNTITVGDLIHYLQQWIFHPDRKSIGEHWP